MIPIFQAVISTIFRLKQTCPKCKRDQVVYVSTRLENVHCKFCGNESGMLEGTQQWLQPDCQQEGGDTVIKVKSFLPRN